MTVSPPHLPRTVTLLQNIHHICSQQMAGAAAVVAGASAAGASAARASAAGVSERFASWLPPSTSPFHDNNLVGAPQRVGNTTTWEPDNVVRLQSLLLPGFLQRGWLVAPTLSRLGVAFSLCVLRLY